VIETSGLCLYRGKGLRSLQTSVGIMSLRELFNTKEITLVSKFGKSDFLFLNYLNETDEAA